MDLRDCLCALHVADQRALTSDEPRSWCELAYELASKITILFYNIPTQVFGRTNILTHLQLCVDWISQYNEFIVYDVAQVKIRYLVKVDFEFTNRLRRR
jgi:hypothetical protein